MTAGILNFDNTEGPTIEQGADFLFHFKYQDKNNSLVNLTGYTIKMQIRKNYDDDLILELSTANDRIVIDSNGEADITLTYTETSGIPAGRYIYDMIITDTADFKTKLLKGHVVVEPEVTL